MKATLHSILAVITLTATISTAQAEDSPEARYQRFLSGSAIPKEDFSRLLFAAHIQENASPQLLSFALQNPYKNSVIIGIVVTLSYTEAQSQKEKVIDLFYDCGDLLPLSCHNGRLNLFESDEIAMLKPTISIKEVHVRKLKKS